MNNSTLMWHVTMAVHEDRVRALQQSRRNRSHRSGTLVQRTLGLARSLVCRPQAGPGLVAPSNQFPN